MLNRLVIGTAQLGMDYGIANRTGQPDLETSKSIIKTAWQSGILEFDTAQAYGESEHVLGEVLSTLGINSEVKITSKFNPNIDHLEKNKLLNALEKTLFNLKISKLYSIILHKEELLKFWDKGLSDTLYGFLSSGFVKHLGVSVYSPEMAIKAIKTKNISFIQLPSNLLDHRFQKVGVFDLAEEYGKQIYVRSVFLQGLLLMDSNTVPLNMRFAIDALKKLELFSKNNGISKKTLALLFVKKAYPKTRVIIGVETPDQLLDNLKRWNETLPLGLIEQVNKEFERVDNKILNPSLWYT